MNFKHLEYFIAMAETGSVNKAAERLFISQPALTKALRLMEEELGVKLFERSRSGIAMTPEAEIILPEARKVLRYYEGWTGLGTQAPPKDVDIYLYTSFSDFLLPVIALRFRELYPELNLHLHDVVSPGDYISNDTSRPVLAIFPCWDEAALEQHTRTQGNRPYVLMRGQYECMVSPESPLAQLATVPPEALKEQILVLPGVENMGHLPPNSQPAEILRAMPPSHVLYAESVPGVINLVQDRPNTFALTYYPALYRYRPLREKQLVHVPFEDRFNSVPLCLFYSGEAYSRHPALRELVKSIRETFEAFLTAYVK